MGNEYASRRRACLTASPDAAKIFWEALSALPKNVTDIREKVERLERDFERLDSKFGKDWTEWMDVRESIRELKSAAK